MSDSAKPDLVIGIDLGQTCTGVSYANLSIGTETVRWIQRWPGRAQANENKVPTILVYPHGQTKPSSWGFLAESTAEQSPDHGETKEWFKTYLDPANLKRLQREDPEATPESYEDIEMWYRDYLGLLYEHIKFRLSSELSVRWAAARIEFIFSVPTTWSPHPTVETFRSIIGQAGFSGPANSNHSVTIGLTEAEAAAVHTSTEAAGIFSERDVLLICDAGGGTTDLSALRVTNTAVRALSLEQLDVVDGANIGSAAIDYAFEVYVRKRLHEADKISKLGLSIEEAAWEMMKGPPPRKDYQNIKCEHGAPDETPTFSVNIPGLSRTYSNPSAEIEHGEMYFTKDDLRALFDKQIDRLFRLIDGQLQNLHRRLPDEQVSHLVLSGGLGQSAYVQQKLKNRYANGRCDYENALFLQVRIAPDPQLAVCKGLVADRVRKLKVGRSVLGWRCCRASYGTICKELYEKSNPSHVGRPLQKDPMNGKQYVTGCVAWFIKKGEPVSIDQPIVHDFSRRIDPGDPRRVFPTTIVVSYDEKDRLPSYMGPGVTKLCDVDSDLSGADETKFKEKNKKFWKLKDAYYRVDYQVKVLIGAADLRFELWFNGQKLSKDKPIKVEWAAATAPSTSILESPPPMLLEEGILKQARSGLGLQRMFSHTPPNVSGRSF